MHILTDENGNPVSCQNDGNCSSCHSHTGEQVHHGIPDPKTPQQMAAVLEHILRQNRQFSASFDRLSSGLIDLDKEEAALHLQKAADEYSKGNLYLSLALSLAKED